MMDDMHRDLDFNLSIVIQFEGYFGLIYPLGMHLYQIRIISLYEMWFWTPLLLISLWNLVWSSCMVDKSPLPARHLKLSASLFNPSKVTGRKGSSNHQFFSASTSDTMVRVCQGRIFSFFFGRQARL